MFFILNKTQTVEADIKERVELDADTARLAADAGYQTPKQRRKSMQAIAVRRASADFKSGPPLTTHSVCMAS